MGFADVMADAFERNSIAKMGFVLRNGQISNRSRSDRDISGPLAGARAEVISGTEASRITATRLAAFGPLGLLMKKKTTSIFVIVSCTNGVELVAEHDAKKMEAKARRWVASFNSRYAS